jgi:apolipoprotein N-acyltransferase
MLASSVLFFFAYPQKLGPVELELFPLAYVCLVPLTLGAISIRGRWRGLWSSMLAGYLAFAAGLYWTFWITGIGTIALAWYVSWYWTAFYVGVRWAKRRLPRVPLTVTVPLLWVALEFVRTHALGGFPWLYLAHSQYRLLPLIQISDVTGAYGVSLLVAAVNGLVADAVVAWRTRPVEEPAAGARAARSVLAPAAAVIALIAAALVYGGLRLGAVRVVDGPLVAAVQGQIPQRLRREAQHASDPNIRRGGEEALRKPEVMFDHHMALSDQALAVRPPSRTPDLVVWPESVIFVPYRGLDHYIGYDPEQRAAMAASRPDDDDVDEAFRLEFQADEYYRQKMVQPLLDRARSHKTYFLVGAFALKSEDSRTRRESELFGSAHKGQTRRNSAFLIDPTGRIQPEFYTKRHLVPFGEHIPFKKEWPWLYELILSFSPVRNEQGKPVDHSGVPGEVDTIFTITTRGGDRAAGRRAYRFAAPICFEITMPHCCRRFVNDPDSDRKRCEFLVNISNDGWFEGTSEHVQHLSSAVFRAVENRVGIARSVNTGVSGFIDPTGQVYGLLGISRPGVTVEPVRIEADAAASAYTRAGDAFAWAVSIAALGTFAGCGLSAVMARARRTRRADEESRPAGR